MELTKEIFAEFVGGTISRNPDWMKAMLEATQLGIGQALKEERGKSADLAYALSVLVAKHPATVNRNIGLIQPGINALCKFFKGSPFYDKITYLYKEE